MKLHQAIEEITGLKKSKVSYTDIAQALGVSRQYANQIKEKELTSEQLIQLEQYFNIKFDIQEEDDDNSDFTVVEHINISPSCGHGTSVYHDVEVTPIKLGNDLIKNIFKISTPKSLKTFQASGDSMSPSIEDGDILLVDTERKDFHNGGIFLITINEDWFIKRLRQKINGDLEIISDNKEKYPTETIKMNDEVALDVKGRIIKNLSRGL